MTMTQQSNPGGSRGSPTMGSELDLNLYGLDAASIKAIQTAVGWVNIDDCEFVQFAIGTAHSPLSPTKVFPGLRYRAGHETVVTPLNQVISFSQARQT